MTTQAGFAEIDITPAPGIHKIGWLKDIVVDHVLDPLYARAAVFLSGEDRVAIVQLDTLFVAWPEVRAIRTGIEDRYGFPGACVLVAATHNHAGPAVTHAGDVAKDEGYTRDLVDRVLVVFGRALAALEEAEVGMASCFEWRVAHNRRVVMRDGTVRTHGTFDDPKALYVEGPVDPELAVIAARNTRKQVLGAIVNYSCHPTHHGGDSALSAGYPGVLARELESAGCPVTLYLNGASGDLHTADPRAGGQNPSQNDAGLLLAETARRAIQEAKWGQIVPVSAASQDVDLPYRVVSEQEITGRTVGAQRFIDPSIYDRRIPALVRKIKQHGTHRAEIQCLRIGDRAIVGLPGEVFCELGLQIKQAAFPLHALVASCANGRVGYVPTREAFARGGYETTFGPSSMLAPEAGDLMVQAAADLLRGSDPDGLSTE